MSVAASAVVRPNSPMSLFGARAATGSVAIRAAAGGEPSVSVPMRSSESPAQLRGRVLRAASRLQLMLAAGDRVPSRWMLRLEREGAPAVMPLPTGFLHDDAKTFARRLPDAALRGVERVVLQASPATPRHHVTASPITAAVA